MLSRYEYLFMKSKIRKMEGEIFYFENSQEFTTWEKYVALPEFNKEELAYKWEEYYKEVNNGFYAQKAREAAECFKLNGTAESIRRVKAIVKEVQESKIPYVKKPSSIDPEELRIKMEKYFDFLHELSQTKKLVEEFAPVYENKSRKEEIGEL